jgi:hypothetical protein
MNRTLKIFVACAFGGGIGTVVALQVHLYLWWLGLIVGGFVGYISYEFKTVLSAIRIAGVKVFEFRPNWQKISRNSAMTILIVLGLSWCFIIIFAGMFILGIEPGDKDPPEWAIISLLLFSSLFGAIPIAMASEKLEMDFLFIERKDTSELWRAILYMNPISYCFYWTPLGLFLFVKNILPILFAHTLKGINRAISKICLFVKTAFVLIHSEIRLLCLFDAAIGTGIGYLAGSPIIGAIAGGLIGVLNYEIISKRILHLVPVRKNSV